MSAGVSDQRMKGQGNQEHLESGGGSGETDFESWRHQGGGSASHTTSGSSGSHTASGAGGGYSAASGGDPYAAAAGYYSTTAAAGNAFPFQAFGVNDGTWSNGSAAASAADSMAFLGGYATHDSYGVDAFGQPSTFNYFPGNGDYSTWGSHNQQRKPHYDDYYRTDQSMYAQNPSLGMPDSSLGLKTMEHGMQNLNLDMSNSLHGNQILQNPSMGQMVTSSNLSIGNKDKESLKNQQDKDNLGLSHSVASSAPKKMTWASIASQPAKPQVSTQSTGLKKKGPGMPPPPMIPGKHNMDIGTWDTSNKNGPSVPPPPPPVQNVPSSPTPPLSAPTPVPASIKQQTTTASLNNAPAINNNVRPSWQSVPGSSQNQQGQGVPQLRPQSLNMGRNVSQPIQNQNQQHVLQQNHGYASQQIIMPPHMNQNLNMPPHTNMLPMTGNPTQSAQIGNQQIMQQQHPVSIPIVPHPVLDELRVKNNYNPSEFDLTAPNARFFVIKSYSEDDIHRSIKYEIWCSTEHGNKRLDQAYREREKVTGGMVYLFFSVNGSGHFCGMAQMVSAVDYSSNSSVWSQNKWKGQFKVRWIYVKDVPNVQLRHIRLENNENKPVTNSRDTQEVPHPKGQQVLRILHSYRHSTSIFDDFIHYEKRQEEEDSRKAPAHEMQHGGNFENKSHGDYNNDHKSGQHHGGYEKHRGMRDHQNNSGNNYRDRGSHDMHSGYHDNHQRLDRDNQHQRLDSRDNHHSRMDSRDNHQRMDSRDHYRDGANRGGPHRDHDGQGGHRMHHGIHSKDHRGEHGNRGRGRGRN